MSLIELLYVIAIITLLAALLLPALSQGQARARQIQCVNHLHEAGVALASFANDHDGRFPMAVPGSAGGSLDAPRASHSATLLQDGATVAVFGGEPFQANLEFWQ